MRAHGTLLESVTAIAEPPGLRSTERDLPNSSKSVCRSNADSNNKNAQFKEKRKRGGKASKSYPSATRQSSRQRILVVQSKERSWNEDAPERRPRGNARTEKNSSTMSGLTGFSSVHLIDL